MIFLFYEGLTDLIREEVRNNWSQKNIGGEIFK